MGAALLNAKRTYSRGQLGRMTISGLIAALKHARQWSAFKDKYSLVEIDGRLYGPAGEISTEP